MPLTVYTEAQKRTLDGFTKIPSFKVRDFSFYNTVTKERIDNAISITETGDLKFKDKHTEVLLSDLLLKKDFIVEEVNEFDEDVLYFQDNFTNKITLGDIYENLQRSVNTNFTYWHSDRVSKNLEGGLDRFIIEELYESFKDFRKTNDEDDDATLNAIDVITDTRDDLWKNKWLDIPCMDVVTHEYVRGKFANISAKISMKVRQYPF